MAKQVIEVDVPEGYEAVRIGCVAEGEMYPTMCGGVVTATDYQARRNLVRLIVRPAWQWPEWLNAPYIAKDSDGLWFAYASRPTPGCTRWGNDGGCIELTSKFVAFVPPPDSYWLNTLRRNPRCTEAQ